MGDNDKPPVMTTSQIEKAIAELADGIARGDEKAREKIAKMHEQPDVPSVLRVLTQEPLAPRHEI